MDIKQDSNQIYEATDYERIKKLGYRLFIERFIKAQQPRLKYTWEVKGDPVFAEVINGTWCVKCFDCKSAQYVTSKDPFLCGECVNASNGYFAREIIFPQHRTEIELILSKRPMMKNRNWLLGETLDQLHKENRDHGIKD